MRKKDKITILILLTVMSFIILIIIVKPVSQDTAYHNFADHRKLFNIPNFFNVISNLPFLFVGLNGFQKLRFSQAPPSINRMYVVLFIGILLTALGSTFYHYAPDNNSLVYDRLPMTLVFMAFVSSVITSWIDIKAGKMLLVPLLLLGMGSVLYWHYTELQGAGDLRFYAFIQYFPMLLIPLIFLLFRNPTNNKALPMLGWVMGWYIIAKLLETFDKNIYAATHFISGHSLKHIVAAIATWYIVRFFEMKHTVFPNNNH